MRYSSYFTHGGRSIGIALHLGTLCRLYASLVSLQVLPPWRDTRDRHCFLSSAYEHSIAAPSVTGHGGPGGHEALSRRKSGKSGVERRPVITIRAGNISLTDNCMPAVTAALSNLSPFRAIVKLINYNTRQVSLLVGGRLNARRVGVCAF